MNQSKEPKKSLREHLKTEDRKTFEERIEEIGVTLRRPPRDDPRHHGGGKVRPGGRGIPAGGSSGEYMGGSAKKRKGQSG